MYARKGSNPGLALCSDLSSARALLLGQIGLQLAVGMRARLAQQFLALPVGRDMMLWNIIVGRKGLYAIDQEGHAYDEGKVPWGERVWPYCISVRDCFETQHRPFRFPWGVWLFVP